MKFDDFKEALRKANALTGEPFVHFVNIDGVAIGVQCDENNVGWISIVSCGDATSPLKLSRAFDAICRELADIRVFFCECRDKRVAKLCSKVMSRVNDPKVVNNEREIFMRQNLWAV